MAAHISSVYLLVGCGWILVSDWITFADATAKEAYWIQTSKGLFYVFATAVLLFVMIRRYVRLLGESERRFRALVEGAPDAVILVQGDGRIAYMNAAARRLIGASSSEQMLGRYELDLVHPDSRAGAKERIATVTGTKASVMCREETYLRLDGSTVVCEVSAVPIQLESHDGELVFVRDATERKHVQQQQSHAQKMDLLQQLAGKIAHALNNLVQVVNGNAELARTSLSPDVPAQIYLGQVLRAGRQASDWVAKIMEFSGTRNPNIDSLEMAEKTMEAWMAVAYLPNEHAVPPPGELKPEAEKVRCPASVSEPRAASSPVVLLAEDDEMVRRLTERFLKQAGYSVLLAKDGAEAVEVFAKNGQNIVAAVLDVVMPRMSGFEVYEHIRACDARLPVVFASGFSGYRKPEHLELIPGVNFLQKPFDCNELVAMVRQSIENRHATYAAGG